MRSMKSSWRREAQGLTLFNIFISDLGNGMVFTLSKLMKNTKWRRVFDTPDGHATIPKELNRLHNWAQNFMNFNPEKCHVLHLGRNNPLHRDRLGLHRLESSLVELASCWTSCFPAAGSA